MSKLKARALEGMLGGVLGGTAGGLGAALFHEPAEPREWADEYGNIYDRPLTVEEKKARRQAVAQAALLGAVGGAGLSMAGSALVGRRLASVEKAKAEEAVQDILEPFRQLISEYKTEAARVANSNSPLAQRARKRVAVAEELYKQQEQQADKMVDTVMDRRAYLPFRGSLHPSDSGSIDWRQLSATHLIDQYFDGVAKKHGFPPVFTKIPRSQSDAESQAATVKQVFDRMVDSAMSKTSSEAFQLELEKISKKRDPRKFAGMTVLPTSRRDRVILYRRLKEAGLRYGCLGLKKTEKGYAVHTRRARSDWYPTVADIPLDELKFIASTG